MGYKSIWSCYLPADEQHTESITGKWKKRSDTCTCNWTCTSSIPIMSRNNELPSMPRDMFLILHLYTSCDLFFLFENWNKQTIWGSLT